MRTLNEWARDNNYQLDTYDYNQSNGMETLYDEELITQQVNDWLHKLSGLCSSVPAEDRAELVEQIIKAIRQNVL